MSVSLQNVQEAVTGWVFGQGDSLGPPVYAPGELRDIATKRSRRREMEAERAVRAAQRTEYDLWAERIDRAAGQVDSRAIDLARSDLARAEADLAVIDAALTEQRFALRELEDAAVQKLETASIQDLLRVTRSKPVDDDLKRIRDVVAELDRRRVAALALVEAQRRAVGQLATKGLVSLADGWAREIGQQWAPLFAAFAELDRLQGLIVERGGSQRGRFTKLWQAMDAMVREAVRELP